LEIKSIALELQRLEFLLVYVKTVSFSECDMIALYTWLAHCIGLKELWVRNGNIYVEIDAAGPCEHCVEPYDSESV
jgi:hypothetical protein